jgi:hypothetical protein
MSEDLLAIFDAACEAIESAPPLSAENMRPEIVLFPSDIAKLAPFMSGMPPAIDLAMPLWLAKAGAECRARPRARRLPRIGYDYDYAVTTEADRAAERMRFELRWLSRVVLSPLPPFRITAII